MKGRITLMVAVGFSLAAGVAEGQAPAPHAQLTEQQAASGQFKVDDQGTVIRPSAQLHFEAALKVAGNTIKGPLALCNTGRPPALRWNLPTIHDLRSGPLPEGQVPAPTRIFDNLYYLGAPNVSSFAIDTPEGIIMIDTLNNGHEAQSIIAGGLRKLGLDPARIKYVIVTHGHGDHYGGAAWLQKTFGAHVLMSDKDWTLSPTTLDKPFFDPAPPRDMVITDGQKLTLGGETVTMVITPGHTQGTVSLLFPVTDHGHKHMAALWGGTGYNFPHSPDRFAIYANSAKRFAAMAQAAGADVYLSNHPENDQIVARSMAVAARKPGEPNPFVIGTQGVQKVFTVLNECALAYGEQVRP